MTQAYTVITVCEGGNDSVATLHSRTPEDDKEIKVECDRTYVPPQFEVSGTMVQPGIATFNGVRFTSTTGNWSFDASVNAGTYDLIAASADRVAVQRGLVVAGDMTLAAPIDVSQSAVMVPTSFSITNPIAGEEQLAATLLVTPNCQPQAQIYLGPLASVKVAPVGVVQAGETQEVSLRSILADGEREGTHSMRKVFKVGDSTAFTLWDPFKSFTFPTTTAPAASWTRSQDEMGNLWISITSLDFSREMVADLSKRYLQETEVTSVSFDINEPWFRPAWKPNLSAPHTRDFFAQDVPAGEVRTVSLSETIDGPGTTADGLAKAKARAAQRMQARTY